VIPGKLLQTIQYIYALLTPTISLRFRSVSARWATRTRRRCPGRRGQCSWRKARWDATACWVSTQLREYTTHRRQVCRTFAGGNSSGKHVVELSPTICRRNRIHHRV